MQVQDRRDRPATGGVAECVDKMQGDHSTRERKNKEIPFRLLLFPQWYIEQRQLNVKERVGVQVSERRGGVGKQESELTMECSLYRKK